MANYIALNCMFHFTLEYTHAVTLEMCEFFVKSASNVSELISFNLRHRCFL